MDNGAPKVADLTLCACCTVKGARLLNGHRRGIRGRYRLAKLDAEWKLSNSRALGYHLPELHTGGVAKRLKAAVLKN